MLDLRLRDFFIRTTALFFLFVAGLSAFGVPNVLPDHDLLLQGDFGGPFEGWYLIDGADRRSARTALRTVTGPPSMVVLPERLQLQIRKARVLVTGESSVQRGRTERSVLVELDGFEQPVRVTYTQKEMSWVPVDAAISSRVLVRFSGIESRDEAEKFVREWQHADIALEPLSDEGLFLATHKGAPVRLDTLDLLKAKLMTGRRSMHQVVRIEEDKLVSTADIPPDTRFDEQWGLHNFGQTGGITDADIDAPEAWDITEGSPDVVVAIIDTGIDYLHPELAANIWVNPHEIPDNNIDDDNNGLVDDWRGWDFRNNDNDPMDDNASDAYHGTHVAGTVAAARDDEGVVGVAPGVKLLPIKFLDQNGNGSISDGVKAVRYVADLGIHIANNSWTGSGSSEELQDAVDDAFLAGTLLVAAAGNSNNNNDSVPQIPASLNGDHLLAVAASTDSDTRASFSNYGLTSVDLAAPGDDILSTIRSTEVNEEQIPQYGEKSGTSMASPHVAGVAALVMSRFPDMSHVQVANRILGTTDLVPVLSNVSRTGGRLNAFSALNDPGPDVLTFHNSEGVAYDWSAASNVSWLSLSATAGTLSPGQSITLTVAANAQAETFFAGAYTGLISISFIEEGSVSASSLLTRTIRLDVNAGSAGRLALNSNETYEAAGVLDAPATPESKSYLLQNIGNDTITVTIAESASWLTTSAATVTLLAGRDEELVLSIDSTDLPVGEYEATVNLSNITSNLGNTSIPVSLVIIDSGGLVVTPGGNMISEGFYQGPFSVTEKGFTVRNISDKWLDWTASKTANWIFTSTSGGRLSPNPEDSTNSADLIITLNVIAESLLPGVHVGQVEIYNATDGLLAAVKTVTLTIFTPATLQVTGGESWDIIGFDGGPFAPSNLGLTLRNIGDGSLNWDIIVADNWIQSTATSGNLVPDAIAVISFNLDQETLADLPVGTHHSEIQVRNTTNGLGNKTIPVTVTVQEPAFLRVTPGRDWLAVGAAGTSDFRPAAQQWICLNEGDETMLVTVSSDSSHVSISSPVQLSGDGTFVNLSIGPGQHAMLDAELEPTVSELAPGDHSSNLSFVNQTRNDNNTTIGVTLRAIETAGRPRNLVYKLKLSGKGFEPEALKVKLSGWLVIDLATGFRTALVTWKDGREVFYDEVSFAPDLLSEFFVTIKGKDNHFLSMTSTVFDDAVLAGLQATSLQGRLSEVDIGEALIADVAKSLSGYLYQAETNTWFSSKVKASLDRKATQRVNDLEETHRQILENLMAELDDAGAASSAIAFPPEISIKEPAAGDPALGVFNLKGKAGRVLGDAKIKVKVGGYFIVDLANEKASLFLTFDDGIRTFRELDLNPDQLLVQTLDDGRRVNQAFHLLDMGLDAEPYLVLHGLLSGKSKVEQLGGGHALDLAAKLKGALFIIEADPESHWDVKLSARYDKSTSQTMNGRDYSLEDAARDLRAQLLFQGWAPLP